MDKMEGDLKEFFKLPLEEKEVFAPVPGGLQGYGQKLDVNEEKLEWHDLLFLITRPLDSKNLRFWPTHPSSFRSIPKHHHFIYLFCLLINLFISLIDFFYLNL